MTAMNKLTIYKVNGDIFLEIPEGDIHSIDVDGPRLKVLFAFDGGQHEEITSTLPFVYRRNQDT